MPRRRAFGEPALEHAVLDDRHARDRQSLAVEAVAPEAARAQRIIVRHNERLDLVRTALQDAPQPAFKLSQDALGTRSQSFAVWLIMSQTLAYLEHLVHLGEADEIVADGMKRYRKSNP